MGKRLATSRLRAEVKTHLASFDRGALLGVLQGFYAADEGNRTFHHARFGVSEDPLQPYKKIIDASLWPDSFRGQRTSASTATQAISQYKKALGDPLGLAELLVFYCERAVGFCRDVDHRNTAYLNALVRTFEQALKITAGLNRSVRNGFRARLDHVRSSGRRLGNGVGEDMDVLLSEFDYLFTREDGSWA